MPLEDWIIPLSLQLSKELLPSFTVSPVQTYSFNGKLIKPKEKSTISDAFNRSFKLSFLPQENLWVFKGEKNNTVRRSE